MNFPVLSGSIVLVGMTITDEGLGLCTHLPTDTMGSTYTLVSGASDSYTGTIHSYQSCVFYASMTSAGINTLTLPTTGVGTPPNVAAVVMEVGNITSVGAVGTNAGTTAGPPASMSATSPAADSFLVCVTRNSAPGGPPPTLPTTTQGYSAIQSAYNEDDHGTAAYLAYGVVGSGSKSCTLQTSGNGAVMAIFPKN